MNSSELLELSRRVDKYVHHMRDHVTKEEQTIAELEKEKNGLEDEMKRQISRITSAATDQNAVKAATNEIERQYRQREDETQRKIDDHQKALQDVQQELDEAERVHTEVKKHEGLFRDIEMKAQTWIDKARRFSMG